MSENEPRKGESVTDRGNADSLTETGNLKTETIDLDAIFDEASEQTPANRRIVPDSTGLGKFLQAMPIPVFLIDTDGRIIFANESCEKLDPDLPAGRGTPVEDLFPDEQIAGKVRSLIDNVFATRKPRIAEGPLRAESETLWGRMHFRTFRFADRKSILMLIEHLASNRQQYLLHKKHKFRPRAVSVAETQEIGMDRTERISSLPIAETSDWGEALPAFLRQSPEGAVVIEADSRAIMFVNDAASELLDRRPDEIIGRAVGDLRPTGDGEPDDSWFDEVLSADGIVPDVPLAAADGTHVPLDLAACEIPWSGGTAYVLTMRAPARSRTTVTQTDDEEHRCRSMVENAPVGLVFFGADGRIAELNHEMLGFLGSGSLDEARGINLLDHPPLVETGVSSVIAKCLTTGKPASAEFSNKIGSAHRKHSRLQVTPIIDTDGRVVSGQALIQDVSDVKRADVLLVQSERLKAVSEMAGAVAHNFNNLLQFVAGGSRQALGYLEARNYNQIRPLLEEIFESGRNAVSIVRRLQQFSRARKSAGISRFSQAQLDVFDLSDAVREGLEKSKIMSDDEDIRKRRVTVKVELDLNEGCLVEGEESEIVEVVSNLLKNAEEALPVGGTVTVKTAVVKNQVVLTVQDNGVGIPEQNLGRVFEPFWSTKDGHLGMGLTINFGIVRRHRGSLTLQSNKRRGTTFTVQLPLAEKPVIQAEPEPRAMPQRQFRILLIDDDEPIVKIFDKGLKRLGQQPLTASSGQQGLKILEETEVDAVVCDLVMPGMNGWEIARAVHEMCLEKGVPKPPFIMLTGWAGQLAEDEIVAHPDVDRIAEKPIKVNRLLEIIKHEVEGAGVPSRFAGSIDGIDLLEYLQLMMLTGKPAVVEVRLKNRLSGHIFIRKGGIVHATCGPIEGEEALYRCINFEGGTFSNLPWREPDRITIDKPGEYLLLEAVRRRDEQRSLAEDDLPET